MIIFVRRFGNVIHKSKRLKEFTKLQCIIAASNVNMDIIIPGKYFGSLDSNTDSSLSKNSLKKTLVGILCSSEYRGR